MPNKDVHVKVGMGVAVAGTSIASIAMHEKLSLQELLVRIMGATIGGYLGARVPDIIDPPSRGPHHRSTGHAIIPNGAAYCLLYQYFMASRHKLVDDHSTNKNLFNQFIIGGMDGLVAGQASHLILDSRTPFGLPIVK